MEYYLARLYCSQEIRGKSKDFSKLKNTWQVSLLGRKNLFKDESLMHRFEYYDKDNGVVLGGRTAVFTLELKKMRRLLSKSVQEMTSLERWACFFRYSANKAKRPLINEILEAEEEIAMAGKVVKAFTKKELEFFHNISKEKYEVDMAAKRALMRERLKKQLRREGRAEGREEALLEGARKLKNLGGSAETIAAVFGLSPEQIKEL
jgi:predicted transposase/invertase (TIGR01784 family)